ncbi:MAG: hypothetical protein FJ171_08660 [Gammaproteobacteria bacterium]|nr:hypothetical protein [Gammaproteobacteria bacterium]
MRARRRAAAILLAGITASGVASAGGPLVIQTSGEPYTWGAATIAYRTDGGNLSASVNNAAAIARVAAMFAVWQDVPSASITYSHAGAISDTGAFTDGNVSTETEYNAVDDSCDAGEQSPIVFDEAAEIFIALGLDETSVIGFAGPCALDLAQGRILSGIAVMNGLFQDGDEAPVPDLTTAEFDATFVHEFGHFSGLDHAQVNWECGFRACGADNLVGLPTMFPFLVSAQQGSLSIDDVGWISKLYPAGGGAGFNATHGTITGTIYFSDGESQAQLVNVVARRVDAPGGADESRTTAANGVSGNKFRIFHGNPINEPGPEPFGPFRSQDPSHIGFYEIPLPPGDYLIDVESIQAEFTEGSSVGGERVIAMPGSSPGPVGPVTVAAGVTSPGNDVTLVGTPPRFDAFEGP